MLCPICKKTELLDIDSIYIHEVAFAYKEVDNDIPRRAVVFFAQSTANQPPIRKVANVVCHEMDTNLSSNIILTGIEDTIYIGRLKWPDTPQEDEGNACLS